MGFLFSSVKGAQFTIFSWNEKYAGKPDFQMKQ